MLSRLPYIHWAALSLLCLGILLAQGCRKTIEDAVIEETLGRLGQSLEDRDRMRFNSLVSRDALTVLVTPRGIWSGWAAVNSIMDPFFADSQPLEIYWKDLNIRWSRKGVTAGVSARVAVRSSSSTDDFLQYRFLFTGFFEKKYNRWLISQAHLSVLEEGAL